MTIVVPLTNPVVALVDPAIGVTGMIVPLGGKARPWGIVIVIDAPG